MNPIFTTAVSMPIAVALFLCSAAVAQKATAPVEEPSPLSTLTAPVSQDDEQSELENLTLVKERILREHSDASGHVRPDLRSVGIAHMRRMKVATHIGPIPTALQDKSK